MHISQFLAFLPTTRCSPQHQEAHASYLREVRRDYYLLPAPRQIPPPPPAFLHVKTGFLPPPPSPFRYRWHRRAASEPALLFCTTGRRLKIWKARGQRAISLGKQGKRFPSLPSTCLWVTQPLSAKLRPARLAVGACPVPKSRPTVTS